MKSFCSTVGMFVNVPSLLAQNFSIESGVTAKSAMTGIVKMVMRTIRMSDQQAKKPLQIILLSGMVKWTRSPKKRVVMATTNMSTRKRFQSRLITRP